MDYSKLKPGTYIARGDQVTELKSVLSLEQILAGNPTGISAETIASKVAWVFSALNAREQMLGEIEYTWEQNGNELEKPPYPFGWNTRKAIQRTDKAVVLYGAAYWYKERTRGGKLNLKWLDPRTITTLWGEDGLITGYERRIGGALKETFPATDVIRIAKDGIAEMGHDTPAGDAIRIAAEILYYLQGTTKSIFASNALPIMVINVPASTSDAEKDRLKAFFRRLFNPDAKTANPEYRVIPVKEGVTVSAISLRPKDLEMTSTRDNERDTILAALGVPLSEVLGNAANFATAELDRRRFISRMGAVWSDFTDVIDNDPDFKKAGLILESYPERHPDLQKDDEAVSNALKNYAEIFTPEAAAYLLGITVDDFPAGMEVFKKAEPPPPSVQPVQPGTAQTNDTGEDMPEDDMPEMPEAMPMRAVLSDLDKWAKYATNHPDKVGEFKSHAIPTPFKAWVIQHIQEAPAEMAQVFERARQIAAQDAPTVLAGLQALLAGKTNPTTIINNYIPSNGITTSTEVQNG